MDGLLSQPSPGVARTTGTFTMTATGFSVDPTGTARWEKIGSTVILQIPFLTGTSDATTMTLTGMPADLVPVRTQNIGGILAQNNGVNSSRSHLQILASSSVIDCYYDAVLGAWTASGTKSMHANTVIWSID